MDDDYSVFTITCEAIADPDRFDQPQQHRQVEFLGLLRGHLRPAAAPATLATLDRVRSQRQPAH